MSTETSMIFQKECQAFNQKLPGMPGYMMKWLKTKSKNRKEKQTSQVIQVLKWSDMNFKAVCNTMRLRL